MPYSHVLLDFDHTLLDTDSSLRIAFVAAMTSAGIDSGADLYDRFSIINRRLWTAVERGELTPGEVHVERFRLLLSELDHDVEPQHIATEFAAGMGAHGDLYPGARGLLEDLSDVSQLALVTNGLSSIQRARIERLDLEQYFSAIVISAEVDAAKPLPTIFDVVFERLSWPAKEDVIMVGDSLASDIKGGVDYGISTCWFNPNQRPSAAEIQPTYEVTTLESIAAIVGGRS